MLSNELSPWAILHFLASLLLLTDHFVDPPSSEVSEENIPESVVVDASLPCDSAEGHLDHGGLVESRNPHCRNDPAVRCLAGFHGFEYERVLKM